jgi:hypothetical protein
MIKGLMGSNGVMVSDGNTSLPYINQNSSNPIQGMIRVWGTDLQVFDGTAWVQMGTSYATVSLDHDAQALLEWARLERTKQRVRADRVRNNPALKIAFDKIKKAEENFNLQEKFVEFDNEEYPKG